MKLTAMIASAGFGSRMKSKLNKTFLKINGEKILSLSIKKILSSKYVSELFIIIKDSDRNYLDEVLEDLNISVPVKIIIGGKERQDSIYNGLLELSEDTDMVLTHDGARPLVEHSKIDEVIEVAAKFGAATLANKIKDTIKVSHDGLNVDYTPIRSELFAVQTPQVFKKELLINAYKQAYAENYYGTDDCSLVEKTGVKVKLVENSYKNIKITTPEDLILAKALMEVE